MNKNTLIASIIALLLGAAGAIFGFDYKGAVCGNPDAKPAAESQAK